MTKTAKPDTIRPGRTYVHRLGTGITLHAEVSPCVFMYPGYPLQLTVELKRNDDTSMGVAYPVNRSLHAETATETDVRRLLSGIQIIPCRRCSSPAYDPSTVKTNRNGLCEGCFLADIQAELAEIEKVENRKLAKRDQKMKSRGSIVRVSAWIHPKAGGDDYQIDWYFATRPTPSRVRTLLRAQGSSVLDDFEIVRL